MSLGVLRAEVRPRVSLGALWFGLLAGPLAWIVQELVGYGFAARACGAPGLRPIPLAPALGIGELVVSGAAIVLAAAGLVTAGLAWRRAHDRSNEDERPAAGDERSAFMALTGMMSAFLFLLAVLMNVAGYFLVPPCA